MTYVMPWLNTILLDVIAEGRFTDTDLATRILWGPCRLNEFLHPRPTTKNTSRWNSREEPRENFVGSLFLSFL